MDASIIGIIIALCSIAFGFGVWFHKIGNRLNKIDNNLSPLIFLHKEEFIKYYLEKGIMPNPSITPRKKYLIDRLDSSTISSAEAEELSNILKVEERRAREAKNIDALIAILGLIALVALIAKLSK